MEYTNVYKGRYSVRSYLDKKIEDEVLNKICEAGRIAPSAKNKQPLKILVLKSEEALDKINKVSKCIYGALVVFVVCYDELESWKNEATGVYVGTQDASIACTQMMLEAWNQGVGSCWINMFDVDKLREEFNLPETIVPVCLLILGYPTEEAQPSEMHHTKKSYEEIFVEL